MTVAGRFSRFARLGRLAAWAVALAVVGSTVAGAVEASRLMPESPTGLGAASPADALSRPTVPLAHSCHRAPVLVGTVVVPRVVARHDPSPGARAVATFGLVNPQGAVQVFDLQWLVLGRDGARWYRALLPIRPNGTTGYVPASAVRVAETSYRIVVDARRLRLTLWKGCRRIRTYPIGLGKESTPTPIGHFYLISLLRPPTPDSAYGPFAYGLSAYSDAITDWAGGGVIGLHGTNDPTSIGKRVSHGCIRMRNQDIEHLVPILPLGTPVDITD